MLPCLVDRGSWRGEVLVGESADGHRNGVVHHVDLPAHGPTAIGTEAFGDVRACITDALVVRGATLGGGSGPSSGAPGGVLEVLLEVGVFVVVVVAVAVLGIGRVETIFELPGIAHAVAV